MESDALEILALLVRDNTVATDVSYYYGQLDDPSHRKQLFDYNPRFWFVSHGLWHARRVMDNVQGLLLTLVGYNRRRHNLLKPLEIRCLLYASLFHDIGMSFLGDAKSVLVQAVPPRIHPEDWNDALMYKILRDHHGFLSALRIESFDHHADLPYRLPGVERNIVAAICRLHQSGPLGDAIVQRSLSMTVYGHEGLKSDLRCGLLAGLLALADACDTNRERVGDTNQLASLNEQHTAFVRGIGDPKKAQPLIEELNKQFCHYCKHESVKSVGVESTRDTLRIHLVRNTEYRRNCMECPHKPTEAHIPPFEKAKEDILKHVKLLQEVVTASPLGDGADAVIRSITVVDSDGNFVDTRTAYLRSLEPEPAPVVTAAPSLVRLVRTVADLAAIATDLRYVAEPLVVPLSDRDYQFRAWVSPPVPGFWENPMNEFKRLYVSSSTRAVFIFAGPAAATTRLMMRHLAEEIEQPNGQPNIVFIQPGFTDESTVWSAVQAVSNPEHETVLLADATFRPGTDPDIFQRKWRSLVDCVKSAQRCRLVVWADREAAEYLALPSEPGLHRLQVPDPPIHGSPNLTAIGSVLQTLLSHYNTKTVVDMLAVLARLGRRGLGRDEAGYGVSAKFFGAFKTLACLRREGRADRMIDMFLKHQCDNIAVGSMMEYRIKQVWTKVVTYPSLQYKADTKLGRDYYGPPAQRLVEAAATADSEYVSAVVEELVRMASPPDAEAKTCLADAAKLSEAGLQACEKACAESGLDADVRDYLLGTANQVWFDRAGEKWQQKAYEEALGCYQKALDSVATHGGGMDPSRYLWKIADCYAAAGNPNRAVECYDRALTTELTEKRTLIDILKSDEAAQRDDKVVLIGKVYGLFFKGLRDLWDSQDDWPEDADYGAFFETWEKHGREAIECFKQAGDPSVKTFRSYRKNYGDLAELYTIWGEYLLGPHPRAAEEKFQSAIRQLDEGIRIAKDFAVLIPESLRERGGLNYFLDQRARILQKLNQVAAAGEAAHEAAQTEPTLYGVLLDAKHLLTLAVRSDDTAITTRNLDLAREVLGIFDQRRAAAEDEKKREEDLLLRDYLAGWHALAEVWVKDDKTGLGRQERGEELKQAGVLLQRVLSRFNDWYSRQEVVQEEEPGDIRTYIDDLYGRLCDCCEAQGEYAAAAEYLDGNLALRSLTPWFSSEAVAREYSRAARRLLGWADVLLHNANDPETNEKEKEQRELAEDINNMARSFLDEARRRLPTHVPTLRTSARLNYHLGRLEQALKDWQFIHDHLVQRVARPSAPVPAGTAWVANFLQNIIMAAVGPGTAADWQVIVDDAKSELGAGNINAWLAGGSAPDRERARALLYNTLEMLWTTATKPPYYRIGNLVNAERFHRPRPDEEATAQDRFLHQFFYAVVRTWLYRLSTSPDCQRLLGRIGRGLILVPQLRDDWLGMAEIADECRLTSRFRIPGPAMTAFRNLSVDIDLPRLEERRAWLSGWLASLVDLAFCVGAQARDEAVQTICNQASQTGNWSVIGLWVGQDERKPEAGLRASLEELVAALAGDSAACLRALCNAERIHQDGIRRTEPGTVSGMLCRLFYATIRTIIAGDADLAQALSRTPRLRDRLDSLDAESIAEDWNNLADAVMQCNQRYRFRTTDELTAKCRVATVQAAVARIQQEKRDKEWLGEWLGKVLSMAKTPLGDAKMDQLRSEVVTECDSHHGGMILSNWLAQGLWVPDARPVLNSVKGSVLELGRLQAESAAEQLNVVAGIIERHSEYEQRQTPSGLLNRLVCTVARSYVLTSLEPEELAAFPPKHDDASRQQELVTLANSGKTGKLLSREWSMLGNTANECNDRYRLKTPHSFAIRCQEFAKSLDPGNLHAYLNLGWLYLYLGQYPQASDAFYEIQVRDGIEKHPLALVVQANVFRHQGKFDAAADCFAMCSHVQLRAKGWLHDLISQFVMEMEDPAGAPTKALELWDSAVAERDRQGTRESQNASKVVNKTRRLVEAQPLAGSTGARPEHWKAQMNKAIADLKSLRGGIVKGLGESLPKGARNLYNLCFAVEADELEQKLGFLRRARDLYEESIKYIKEKRQLLLTREKVALLDGQIARLRERLPEPV